MGGKVGGHVCIIGKGAERSARVLFHTLNIVKLLGVVGSYFTCLHNVTILIGMWLGGGSMYHSQRCSEK